MPNKLYSAYLHMLGDAVSAFGVVIAGVLVATASRRSAVATRQGRRPVGWRFKW